MFDYSREPRYKPGVTWYWAYAEKGIKRLKEALDRGDAPGVLQERIGALVDLGRIKEGCHRGKNLLHIQVHRTGYTHRAIGDDDAGLDLCLAERGIVLDEVMQTDFVITPELINREVRRPVLAQYGKFLSASPAVNYATWSLQNIREYLFAALTPEVSHMANVVPPPRPPAPPVRSTATPAAKPPAPPSPAGKAPPAPPGKPTPPPPPAVKPPAGPAKPPAPPAAPKAPTALAPAAVSRDEMDQFWGALLAVSTQLKMMQVFCYLGHHFIKFVSVAEDGGWAIALDKADAETQNALAFAFGKESPAALAAAIKANEDLDIVNIINVGANPGDTEGAEGPTVEEIQALKDWKSFDAMATRCGFTPDQFNDHKALKAAGLAQAKQALIDSLGGEEVTEQVEINVGDKLTVTHDFDGKGAQIYEGTFVQENADGTFLVDFGGQQFSVPVEACAPAA